MSGDFGTTHQTIMKKADPFKLIFGDDEVDYSEDEEDNMPLSTMLTKKKDDLVKRPCAPASPIALGKTKKKIGSVEKKKTARERVAGPVVSPATRRLDQLLNEDEDDGKIRRELESSFKIPRRTQIH